MSSSTILEPSSTIQSGNDSSTTTVVRGFVAPGFEKVANLFAENFKRGLEVDAQCVAYVGEEKVINN